MWVSTQWVGTMSSEASFEHPLRVVERHAVRDAGAAVVAGDEEALEAERAHDLDLVLGHGAERVVGVVAAAARLGAVAVAAQVGRDDREVLGEPRRDLVPHDVGQRVAVQQQQRRPVAAVAQVDGDPLASIRLCSNPSNMVPAAPCLTAGRLPGFVIRARLSSPHARSDGGRIRRNAASGRVPLSA